MLFSVEECNPVRYLSFVDESEIRYWSAGSDQSQTPAPGKTCNYVQNARLVTKWNGKLRKGYAQEALGCVSCGKCPNLCEGVPCFDDPFVLFRCCVRAVSLDLAPCAISGTNLSLGTLSSHPNHPKRSLSLPNPNVYTVCHPPASIERPAATHRNAAAGRTDGENFSRAMSSGFGCGAGAETASLTHVLHNFDLHVLYMVDVRGWGLCGACNGGVYLNSVAMKALNSAKARPRWEMAFLAALSISA